VLIEYEIIACAQPLAGIFSSARLEASSGRHESERVIVFTAVAGQVEQTSVINSDLMKKVLDFVGIQGVECIFLNRTSIVIGDWYRYFLTSKEG